MSEVKKADEYPEFATVNRWADEYAQLESRREHPCNLANFIAHLAFDWLRDRMAQAKDEQEKQLETA